MREILFRGKKISNGEWAYGYYTKGYFNPETPELLDMIYQFDKTPNGWDFKFCIVDPETVGQFTGMTDKNGKNIFEGDVMCCDNVKGYVVYSIQRCCFLFRWKKFDRFRTDFFKDCRLTDYGRFCDLEIIGNIHDNPELLGIE